MPERDWFHHNPTGIHGISHGCRVLVLANNLADRIAAPEAIDRAALSWAAACHDVGRVNDWYDRGHGERAAEWVLTELVARRPAAAANLAFVAELCRWHETRDTRVPRMTLELMILKDADALDRIRLGAHDFDPARLRLAKAQQLIAPAEALFARTGTGPEVDAALVIEAAAELGLLSPD